MGSTNELAELYDCFSVLYNSLPPDTDSEWQTALNSVLFGGELLASDASCYGKQQNERNSGKRRDYVRRYGNGERITEFSSIAVGEPRPGDKQYVPSDAVLPVSPESQNVLPVMVATDEVDRAISLLAEFPAQPAADRPGNNIANLLDPDRVRQARENTEQDCTNKETTVLFVSDTHLGYENRVKTGRGKTVPWVDEISSSDTFSRITEVAIDQEVDAVIHTGDILDHEVDADTLEYAESQLVVLSSLGIPVYCIIGSHDHESANPEHSNSTDGIAWLTNQVTKGHLTELSASPTPVAGGPLDAYGIPAGNVGIDDVGSFKSREWTPSDITFTPGSPGPNVLCLHDGVTPYRDASTADVNLERLLSQSHVSFDFILVGDEHRPKNEEFYQGYTFQTANGTPVLYTGPTDRISHAYQDHDPFVTELTLASELVALRRHKL